MRGSDNAFAQEASDPIEGVWEAQVTIRDCTTSAARATFQGVEVFHRGGTISDTDSAPTATRGPGFGTWAKSGSDYIVKFRFFTYDPTTGVVSGVIRTTRTVTVGADGKTPTAVNTTQVFDMRCARAQRLRHRHGNQGAVGLAPSSSAQVIVRTPT